MFETGRLDEIETRLEEFEERITELEACTQALRGYVGNIRSVNRDVEQRADAALAKADAMQRRLQSNRHLYRGRLPAGMLRDEFERPGECDPGELQAAYEQVLADTVDQQGFDAVVEATEIDDERLQALLDDESPELTLEEAAAILATDPDRPDAEFIAADARDILLMGMSTAVLDVEAIQSGIEARMDAKEIQQKVEGRYPMTVAEYAVLHQYIESHK